MKYDTNLPTFRAGTKIETVMNKLNHYKTLIDAQVVAYDATGIINEPPPISKTKEQKESFIPIPTKHKK